MTGSIAGQSNSQRFYLNDQFWRGLGDVAFGTAAERAVGAWMRHRGISLVPVREFGSPGGAPLIQYDVNSDKASGVLPDIQFWERGTHNFGEVKAKRQWVRSRGRLETGCDEPNYLDYVRAQRAGSKLWMLFLHVIEAPTGLFAAELEDPKIRAWDGLHDWTRERKSDPLRLWPFSAVRQLATLEEVFEPENWTTVQMRLFGT
jgi:hypothetical protein